MTSISMAKTGRLTDNDQGSAQVSSVVRAVAAGICPVHRLGLHLGPSASLEPSHVLRALGLPDALANSYLRISLGRFSTAAEVDWFSERLREVVSRLRGGAGL